MEATTTVYVRLLDEDVDVSRPVDAIQEGEDVFLLCGPEVPDEHWEFPVGTHVRCTRVRFEDSHGLQWLAAERIEPVHGASA